MPEVERVGTEAIKPLAEHPSTDSIARYCLPTHLRACVTHRCTVMLNLKDNRYLGLGQRETAALQLLLEDWRSSSFRPAFSTGQLVTTREALDLLEGLVDRGLVSRSASASMHRPPSASLPLAVRTVERERIPPNVSVRTALAFAQACFWAKDVIKTQSLEWIAATVIASRSQSSAPTGIDERELATRVHQFRRLQVYSFTALDQCLFHALALTRFLAAFQLFPSWIIGVRTHPWGAHSWVQHEDLVVNDTPEHVLEYTALLVV